jgi:hypothetical protein
MNCGRISGVQMVWEVLVKKGKREGGRKQHTRMRKPRLVLPPQIGTITISKGPYLEPIFRKSLISASPKERSPLKMRGRSLRVAVRAPVSSLGPPG